MKITKYILLACIGASVLFACDPLNDTYEDLDSEVSTGVSADIALTLSEDDYELALPIAENGGDSASMSSYKNFNDTQARKYIPYILGRKYPHLGVGSFVNVTYDLYQGSNSTANSFIYADVFSVSAEDYEGTTDADSVLVAAGFLSPSFNKQNVLSAILTAKVQDPAEGDVYGINYAYASEDPIVDFSSAGLQEIHKEEFEADIDGYTAVSLVGDQTFEYNRFFNGNAAMAGYSGGEVPNDDWLVSPKIDLSDVSDASLKFHQVINYLDVDPASILKVKVSADFSGDVSAANWTELTVDQWPAGNSWSEEVWSTMDISAFDGQMINVAFQYVTTTVLDGPTWEIGEVIVEAVVDVSVEIVENPVSMRDYYIYESGEWTYSDGAYYLKAADYDAMGAPGQYDNFSSSLPADDYIVKFLGQKYAFAQEEDEIVVVYKYYSSSAGATQTRGNLYTFLNGAWGAHNTVIATSLLFAYENKTWVPDNTIKYTLSSSDYSAVAANESLGNADARANLAQYGNFNTNGGYWGKADIIAAINFIIKGMHPNAEEGQKYLVTYNTYPGGDLQVSLILEGDTYVEVQ